MLWLIPAVIALTQMDRFAANETPRYFPPHVFAHPKVFAREGDDGDFSARWYGEQLRALKEPSLFEAFHGDDTVYRFTWLRTFHHPIAVRLTIHSGGNATLTSKMASGAGGYKPGKLILNSTRELGAQDVGRVLALITVMKFWMMPTEPVPDCIDGGKECSVGPDGAQWILEGRRGGEYHVVERWSPESGSLRELGLLLACALGGIKIPEKEIY